jgi:hypothetical protein
MLHRPFFFRRRLAHLVLCAFAASCEGASLGPAPVGSVRIVDPPPSLEVGESVRLSALVLDPSDDPLSDVAVYWGAVDPTVVYVDSVSGIAHAVGPGTTRIVASSKDKRDSIDIVVPQGPRVAFNVLVADALSAADDADEFTFEGTVGQEISIPFLARSGSPADALRLRLLTPGRGEVVFVQSNGDYARAQGSGRLVLAQNGVYTVRVQGVDATDQGPYTFQVARIARTPEVAGATVSANVQVKTETLAPPGDIDEFTYNVAAQQEVNVYFQSRTNSRADTMLLRVLRPNLTVIDSVSSLGDDTGLEGRGIGYLELQPGTYRLQVEGSRHTQGAYSALVRTINLDPETALVPYALGTQVSSETISPVGDVDQFTFDGTTGDSLRITFRATSNSVHDVLRLYLIRPDGFEHVFVQANGAQVDQVFDTPRLTLTAPYRIRVRGLNSNDDAGGYRFQIVKLN